MVDYSDQLYEYRRSTGELETPAIQHVLEDLQMQINNLKLAYESQETSALLGVVNDLETRVNRHLMETEEAHESALADWSHVHQSPSFPIVRSNNTSTVDIASTLHTVNLPTDILSGDTLIIFFGQSSVSSVPSATGWTQFFGGGTGEVMDGFYRNADGSEGSTVVFNTTESVTSAHVSYRIGNAISPAVQAPEANANDGTANPPFLDPTGGSKAFLWLVAVTTESGENATAGPVNYVNFTRANGSVDCASAERLVEASTENPGAFTVSDDTNASAVTVAIHPAVASVHSGEADAHHTKLHTVLSHSDTEATGTELNTLTDGSDADALHTHPAGAGGAPTDATYLVTTAHATLTAGVVVGTTPGGELGGTTWASPTVDTVHAGSAHIKVSHIPMGSNPLGQSHTIVP